MEDYRLEQSGQEVQDILNGAAMQVDLTAEIERATEAEQTLQGNIDIEERDRKAADLTLQGNIDAEELRAKAAEKQNADDIDALEEKVPSGASSSNKLATESYVDDSVSTATATFRGTYNLVSDLHLTVNATEQQIATALALAISTADNNDYCFILVPTFSETPTEIKEIDRYKFNGTAWSFEYKLNNSGFTTAQWAAINSGITSGDVTKLAALPTNAQLTTLLNGKQDVLTFDNVPTEGSSRPVKSGGVYSAIDDEKTARETADSSLSSAIEAILLLIPSAATSLNKLADKAFVNSSIATASATFRGTYNLVTNLSLTVSATHAQIATALAGTVSDEDNNDYAFVQIPTADATPTQIAKTERYKYNGTIWEYEYDLNNSGYTAAQWAAINSGITEALVTKLSALPTNAELTSALGVLTSSITTINQKIPSAASQANQLVDTASMESYIVQVLDVLTASFNVTSTDGHVTVSISQVDGKITSVSVSTSDIASAASLSLIAGRVTTAEGNISTNAADIANLQDAYAALTQSDPVIVKPTDTWPVASPATKTIYRVVDRVNTPPQYYSDYMWNGTTMVLMATYNNAIDDVPTAESNNLVKSGGVIRPYSLSDKSIFFFEKHIVKNGAGVTRIILDKEIPVNTPISIYVKSNSNSVIAFNASHGSTTILANIAVIQNTDVSNGYTLNIPALYYESSFDTIGIYTSGEFTGDIIIYCDKENYNNRKSIAQGNVSDDYRTILPYKEYASNGANNKIINSVDIKEGDILKFIINSGAVNRTVNISLLQGNAAVATDIISINTGDGGIFTFNYMSQVNADGVQIWSNYLADVEIYPYIGLEICKKATNSEINEIFRTVFPINNLVINYASSINYFGVLNIKKGDTFAFYIKADNMPVMALTSKLNNEIQEQDFIVSENQDLSSGKYFYYTFNKDADSIWLYTNTVQEIEFGIINNNGFNSIVESVEKSKDFSPAPSLYLMSDFSNETYTTTRINASLDGVVWKLIKSLDLGLGRDPSLFKYNNKYYLFSTHEVQNDGLKIFQSTDLNDWELYATLHPTQVSPYEDCNDASAWWAPECHVIDGVPYFIITAYFRKKVIVEGQREYNVQPYLMQMSSDLKTIISQTRMHGTNISQDYDFDVTILKIGDYYYECSRASYGVLSIGRSESINGDFDKYKSIPLSDSGYTSGYCEGPTMKLVGDKVFIWVAQWAGPNYDPQTSPKQLGVYICNQNFDVIDFKWLTGGVMVDESTIIIAEHPTIVKGTFKDLLNIL